MNVIISGGSQGIGKAISMQFAAAGSTIFICGRSKEALEKTAAEIIKAHPHSRVKFQQADLGVKTDAERFGAFCLEAGAPDILVNNAGTYLPGSILDGTDEGLEAMLSVNLYSAWYLTKQIVPSMVTRRSGHIFNVCSIASLDAYKGGGSYGISKYALNGFNANLRQELQPYGIKVTAIYPGAVLTRSWGDFDNSDHRIMEAEDIARMVFAATQLSPGAVVDEILVTPLKGPL